MRLFRIVEPGLFITDLIFVGTFGIGQIPRLHSTRLGAVNLVERKRNSAAVSRFHIIPGIGKKVERLIKNHIFLIRKTEIIARNAVGIAKVYADK